MSLSIAFVGVDGAGKTTLIKKISNILNWFVVSHQCRYMRRFYYTMSNIKSWWEWCTLLECTVRNWYWKHQLTRTPMLLDRCYICAIVYSNLGGVPRIAHRLKKTAVRPDVIVLLEPVEELVPNAYKYTREYKRILTEEKYECFRRGFHLFGRVTFWKQSETTITPLTKSYITLIGSP